MCLVALVTVSGSGSAAFGADSRSAARPSAIPGGFRAQSSSWVSPTHGWMLGSAPCGVATCTTVAGTTDGGLTWNRLGTVDAPLSYEDKSAVTEIRFADDLHGWAFQPAVWATSDGGATWTEERSPGGRPVVALAGDADAAYAVVSGCRFGEPTSHCAHPATLWRTTPGQEAWTRVSLTLPVANQALLSVHGTVAYLIVQLDYPDPDVLEVTLDGQQWTSRPDPCLKSENEFLSGVSAVSDTRVALLCVSNIGFGKAEKRARRSNDTALTTIPAGMMPLLGITSQLAAAPNGTLVVSSYSIGSWIYRNGSGQSWTTPVALSDGGTGWNDIVLASNEVGFVIHGPAAYPGFPGELWKTEDGGLTWGPA